MAVAKKKVTDQIILDYTNMLSEAVGPQDGISEKQIKKMEPRAAEAHWGVGEQRRAGKLPFMDLPYSDYAGPIIKYAAEAAAKFDNFVVLGIGGSALGPIAVQSALNSPFYNLLDKKDRKRPRFFVEDNVDPERIAAMLELIDPKKTLFNVITKSGSTAETMSAFIIVRDILMKKLGAKGLKTNMVATTDSKKGLLRDIVDREGLRSFEVTDGVGGRFSVLTPVGLLPAAMAGIDIKGMLAGAAAMDKRCASGLLSRNPALMGAVLQYLADTEKKKTIQVMMPYSNALRDIADWFRQLWAESLGKKYALDGSVVHTGQTPIKALGATDQHSQVQLYNEGPNNKTITFIRVESFRRKVKIPSAYKNVSGLAYLGGHEMGELLNAEETATEIAVTANKRPNCTIRMPEINAKTVGQLIYMLELQTVYAGAFYGINTFDQPGVEEGKVATYALMGRPGYEKQRGEIEKIARATRRKTV
jgi:glucose-6-phosphate isomerase